jgi:hypothetical protein
LEKKKIFFLFQNINALVLDFKPTRWPNLKKKIGKRFPPERTIQIYIFRPLKNINGG